MTKMLERSEAEARGDAPPPPVAKLIGFDLNSVKPGEAVIERPKRTPIRWVRFTAEFSATLLMPLWASLMLPT
jgi:hypothetical protein